MSRCRRPFPCSSGCSRTRRRTRGSASARRAAWPVWGQAPRKRCPLSTRSSRTPTRRASSARRPRTRRRRSPGNPDLPGCVTSLKPARCTGRAFALSSRVESHRGAAMPLSRRAFLASSLAAGTVHFGGPSVRAADTPRSCPPKRTKPAHKRVAVLTSIYCYLSHSYHIAGRFLDGYLKGDEHHFPEFGVASCYVEQVGKNDLSRELAKEHNFRISDTIEDALTLGTGKLAVEGVLLICEHGDYPYNAKAQKLYPRYDYFQKITGVFEKSGKTVPVFCDKHR